MHSLSRAIGLLVWTLLCGHAQTTLVESTFDADSDGWTGMSDTLRYHTDGFVWMRPSSDGDTAFYRAPAKFLGNKSGAYLGFLQFSMRDNRPGNYGNTTVILESHDMQLRHGAPYPTNGWQEYSISLDTNEWRFGANATNPPPTEAQIITVLSDITRLHIRAEYSNTASNETNQMDNVRIVAPLCVSNSILRIYREVDAIRLEWPTNACEFWPYASSSLSQADWMLMDAANGFAPSESNGLFHLTVAPSGPQRFFQLRRETIELR